jgi:hypothetical protein
MRLVSARLSDDLETHVREIIPFDEYVDPSPELLSR